MKLTLQAQAFQSFYYITKTDHIGIFGQMAQSEEDMLAIVARRERRIEPPISDLTAAQARADWVTQLLRGAATDPTDMWGLSTTLTNDRIWEEVRNIHVKVVDPMEAACTTHIEHARFLPTESETSPGAKHTCFGHANFVRTLAGKVSMLAGAIDQVCHGEEYTHWVVNAYGENMPQLLAFPDTSFDGNWYRAADPSDHDIYVHVLSVALGRAGFALLELYGMLWFFSMRLRREYGSRRIEHWRG